MCEETTKNLRANTNRLEILTSNWREKCMRFISNVKEANLLVILSMKSIMNIIESIMFVRSLKKKMGPTSHLIHTNNTWWKSKKGVNWKKLKKHNSAKSILYPKVRKANKAKSKKMLTYTLNNRKIDWFQEVRYDSIFIHHNRYLDRLI